MNVGWIAPLDTKCGIAFYAKRYADALSLHCTVRRLDPDDFLLSKRSFLHAVSNCDCVHLHYETSLFLHDRSDFYPALCRRIRAKKIVTIHELHRKPPGVFPREDIAGHWPIKALKKIAWDFRHPHWAAFAKHQRAHFCADAIVVHSKFQKEILAERGFDADTIAVIPLPIRRRLKAEADDGGASLPLVLGATGFINPSYDYDLLFRVLDAMTTEWRFVWVGGPRRSDDEHLLHRIQGEIDKREWGGMFTITGWVPDEERDALLGKMHVVCAFFKERSSSESLGEAIGASKPIIASRIPLTEELAGYGPVVVLAPAEPKDIARTISEMIFDRAFKQEIERSQSRYAESFGLAASCERVMGLYEKVLSV